MKKLLVIISFVAIAQLFVHEAKSQEQPYWYREIEAFIAKDAQNGVTPGKILFVGSSTFTTWYDLEDSFPDYNVLNRAFGGCSLSDIIKHYEVVVAPHEPSQLIVYIGDNDLCNRHLSVGQFMENVRCFIRMSQIRFPEVDICMVSIKPSPIRRGYFNKYIEANKQLQQLSNEIAGVRFIDTWPLMVDKNNNLYDSDTFKSDSLHMSAKGNAIWAKAIMPYLNKTKK